MIVALLIFTDYWGIIIGNVLGGSDIASNIFFILVIVAAIAIVLWSGKGDSSGGS